MEIAVAARQPADHCVLDWDTVDELVLVVLS